MSDTFDKVTEMRQVTALKERIDLMTDYNAIVTWLNLDKSFKYMIIVNPVSPMENDENWDGKVANIKSAIYESLENFTAANTA